VIEEAESAALQQHLEDNAVLATSSIAIVEVSRAASLANPTDEVRSEVDKLLRGCMRVSVTIQLLRQARRLASASVRSLDAIHLASALRIEPDELVAYDQRLITAGRAHGLQVASPGSAS
jgi:predicted nucleic acid-binding protein